MKQTTDTLLLVRPSAFGFNTETSFSNTFQKNLNDLQAGQKAREEFVSVIRLLSKEHIGTIVIDDQPGNQTPDAVFPNNWVSFHEDGKVIIYPMEAPNRRRERRSDIISQVCETAQISNPEFLDLSGFESKGQYLEGTGSMVFDHMNKKIYMAISTRSHIAPLKEVASFIGYDTFIFHTSDDNGLPVYHTNVVMSIGTRFAVICDSCISDDVERKNLMESFERTNRRIISISNHQMNAYAGNLLEVQNQKGDPFILISESAIASLDHNRIKTLEQFATLLPVKIPVIEQVGGGSIRCMVAEVFRKPSGSGVSVVTPVTTHDFESYFSLRWKVLREPWNQPRGSERDDNENTSQHFMAIFPDGKIAGVARLQELNDHLGQLRYMAVDPDVHGKGIGKLLVKAIEQAALSKGYKKIFLQAREPAVPFYKACGYSVIEKTFLLYDEIQHFSMCKELS